MGKVFKGIGIGLSEEVLLSPVSTNGTDLRL